MKKWNIGWGAVSQCNMNCKFCYSHNVRQSIKDLNYLNWKQFIDENAMNINSINYGTGENSIDKDWFLLVQYIRNKYPHIIQSVTTNGYLSEATANNKDYYDIVKHSIDEVDISLDFADKSLHSEFRGQVDAYKWALNTLKLCVELDKRATIVFLGTNDTLNNQNIKGLFDIAKTFNSKIRMNIYRPTDGINIFTKKFIASYDNIIRTLYFINDNYKVLSISDPLFSSILTNDAFEDDPSGSDSLRILSDGSISPSTYLISSEFRKYNIKSKNVLDKISNENSYVNLGNTIPKDCLNCKYKSNCKGGVFDRRYLWYKSFTKADPYCPFRSGNYLPTRKIEVCKDLKFESVHHGYLPTMFFTN